MTEPMKRLARLLVKYTELGRVHWDLSGEPATLETKVRDVTIQVTIFGSLALRTQFARYGGGPSQEGEAVWHAATAWRASREPADQAEALEKVFAHFESEEEA